jgi:hypothetical protein
LPLLRQLAWANLSAKAKATKPRPLDGAVFGLTPELQLKWKPGVNAKSHKVYFGTEADELSLLAEVETPSDVESPPLEEGLTYYWRVDEVWADGTVVTGDIWSFTIGELVGWWKLDEASGETASDSSGNGNVGTLQGDPAWRPLGGKVGGALKFDGIDDYVDCGSDASLDITNEITIAAWVKTNDSGNSQFNPYVTKGDRTYGLKHHSRNTMEFVIYDGYWRATHFPVDSSFNGVWHHLAGTYNGSELKLYIDGALEVTTAHKGSIASNAANLDIARNSEEAGRFYDGAIDDVRIFNYALSQKEIKALCNVAATKPGPVDEAVVGPATKVELSWMPGIDAAGHKVLFGTEPDELALLAEVTSPAYAELPALQKDAQYYWRVDEVQANGTVVAGDIWSFATSGRLLGWWKLDEVSGGTAEDSSGSDHSGTLHGDQGWQPNGGKVGGALKLDGDGDYVEVSDESDFDLTGQITVAAWIKTRAFDKGRQAIVAKGGSAWRLHRNLKTDNIRFNITYGYEPSAVGKVNVNDGQWHHIVGAYDGAQLCLYVDGELDSSKKTSKSIMTNNEPVCIGENSEQTGRYWNGLIDDVRIYNYALSRDEIAALYQGK